MKTIIISLILLLLITNSYSIDGNLAITIDNYLMDKLNYTLPESVPKIQTTNTVIKHQYFFPSIFFTNPSVINEKIKVFYDIEIIAPNGSTYFDAKDILAYDSMISSQQQVFGCKQNLKMSFENEDSLGIYQMKVILKDNNNNSSVTLTGSIELNEYNYRSFFKSDDEYSEWVQSYYDNLSPENLINSYIYFTKSEISKGENVWLPTISFYTQAFKDNSYLIPYLQEMYFNESLATKIYIIHLLKNFKIESETFFSKLNSDEKKIYDEIKNEILPNPYSSLNHPSLLDMLWSQFFASGSYEPILQIIKSLEYVKYVGSLEEYKNNQTGENDVPEEVYYELVYQAAAWSLKSNCEHLKLVRDYCIYTKINHNLSERANKELAKIIGSFK